MSAYKAALALIADAGHTAMREKRESFNHLEREFLVGQLRSVDDDPSISIQPTTVWPR